MSLHSSKMLAFLRPADFPIWDSWVIKNMLEQNGVDLRLNVKGDVKAREAEALERFDELSLNCNRVPNADTVRSTGGARTCSRRL